VPAPATSANSISNAILFQTRRSPDCYARELRAD
jgi:hypothetical protein